MKHERYWASNESINKCKSSIKEYLLQHYYGESIWACRINSIGWSQGCPWFGCVPRWIHQVKCWLVEKAYLHQNLYYFFARYQLIKRIHPQCGKGSRSHVSFGFLLSHVNSHLHTVKTRFRTHWWSWVCNCWIK